MALADVIAPISALLTGVTCQVGSEFVSVNDVPPRVIWVPTMDRFDGAQRHGAGYRSVKTRVARCDVHVWGAAAAGDVTAFKELRATELLLNRLICFIHQVAHGAYELEGGDWGAAGISQYGRLYVLKVAFRIPVVPAEADQDETTTTFDDVNDMEGTAVMPSGDVTGEPAP
jgi:hypothetical protein